MMGAYRGREARHLNQTGGSFMNYLRSMSSQNVRTRCRRLGKAMLEPLEGRTLFAISIEFDYSLDDNNFFTPERRALLQQAGDMLTSRFGDQLLAIEPGGGNTWTASIFDPSDVDDEVTLDNL